MADLFAHTYWVGYGSRDRQYYGAGGISYLGRLNDTIPNALAISEVPVRSSLVLNRVPGDTARVYEFPGQTVLRGNFNGDSAPDFFCWDAGQGKITILLGTERIDSFRTANVIHAPDNVWLRGTGGIIVADLDSSGYDDVLFLDYNANVAWLFRGSATVDSLDYSIVPLYNRGGIYVSLGHVRDRLRQYVCECSVGNRIFSNTALIRLYPLGTGFTFAHASDSLVLTLDTSRYYRLTNGFSTFDVDGDGVDDFLLSGYDTNYRPDFKINTTVFVYKGGAGDVEYPSYFFHRPVQTYSSDFGAQMVDVGDVTGHGYHSLLVSDPEALSGDGAIFLYNMGRALKDSCVALAQPPMPLSFNNHFGGNLVALPALDSTGLPCFMTSDAGNNHDSEAAGGVYIFRGDPTYGPEVGVEEGSPQSPTEFQLAQNYPNPFSEWTIVRFGVPSGEAREVRVEVFDLLGRLVTQLYRGPSDGTLHTEVLDGSRLPVGTYVCRLVTGGRIASRLMRLAR